MHFFRYTLFLLVLGGLIVGCGQANEESNGPGGPFFGEREGGIPSVEVVQAQAGSLPLEQRLSGTVLARNQVTIFPELSGRIEEVFVDDGELVERGQPLVRLDARQFEDQLRQAEASLRVQQAAADQARARLQELEAQLRRTEELAERDFVSQLELERQRAQVEGARADYNRALAQVEQSEAAADESRQALAETVVRAPTSGRVGRRNAEIGMRVDGSTQLFVVGDLSSVRVNVVLTERMLNLIEEGQTARIHSEALGDTVIVAEVSRISPFLEDRSFTTQASIDISNEGGLLRSGMYVDVDVHYGESEQATLVPNSALREDLRSGRMGIFVATELGDELELPSASTSSGASAELSPPTSITYREVDVIARGRSSSGVSGISSDDWVVAVGHDLLSMNEDEPTQARVRPISWERLLSLQELQQHDLLRQFMDKQQRMAEQMQDSGQPEASTPSRPETSEP